MKKTEEKMITTDGITMESGGSELKKISGGPKEMNGGLTTNIGMRRRDGIIISSIFETGMINVMNTKKMMKLRKATKVTKMMMTMIHLHL